MLIKQNFPACALPPPEKDALPCRVKVVARLF
jgi:hypothetical protein